MIIGVLIIAMLVVASLGTTVLGAMQYTPADFDHFEVDGDDMTWVEQ